MDTLTNEQRIANLMQENANLRIRIDKLEEESNDHYEDYKAAKKRLEALASYINLVKVAVEYSVASKWKKNSLRAALSYLASGAKDRIKHLWEETPNDTFREAWHILQYWDLDLDPDPQLLKEIKAKYTPKKEVKS